MSCECHIIIKSYYSSFLKIYLVYDLKQSTDVPVTVMTEATTKLEQVFEYSKVCVKSF